MVAGTGAARLLAADVDPWQLYQQLVVSNPIETKAVISGVVYSLGDIIAQSYEGRPLEDWDRARILRSGLCGLLAHGPLSHLYYVALDNAFMHQQLVALDSWLVPAMKVAVDQTVWSVLWNSCYYVLLGLFKFESPAVIASTVRNSWWDLLKAGWRLWPFVHFFTYSVVPVQHRLLFVDAVELLWVSILSTYGQEQRRKMLAETPDAPPQVACALPGTDGEGGAAAEEILRALTAEHEIVLEDRHGNRTVLTPADVGPYDIPANLEAVPVLASDSEPHA